MSEASGPPAYDGDGEMVGVRGCPLPPTLLYDVANHMWYRPLEGGLVRLGMTMVAVALADFRIFAFTPKRVGRDLEAGRACATVESSKWVGPARIAFDGVVEAVNEALIERPATLARDPYGAGWMLDARPTGSLASAGLLTGAAAHAAYRAWMDDNDFPGCSPPDE